MLISFWPLRIFRWRFIIFSTGVIFRLRIFFALFQLTIDPEWDRFCQFIVHRINGNRIIFSLKIVIIRTTNAVKSPFRSRFLETMYYTTLYYDIIWTAKHRRHIIVIIVKPNFKPFSAVRLANACAGVCCTRVLWKVSACQMR